MLKLANCHDFIMQFDEGLTRWLSERGLKLSGGQRQRIDIARSFVKILIFVIRRGDSEPR